MTTLILARRIKDSLVIVVSAAVRTLGVIGNQVLIAVDASWDVVVHREELAHKSGEIPISRADNDVK